MTTKICAADSHLKIPFQYAVFDEPFLLFLVSPDQVNGRYRLVLEIPGTPQGLRMLLDERVATDFVYWVKTYPLHRLTNPDDFRRFVFPRRPTNLEV
jgi:hypothetical protein